MQEQERPWWLLSRGWRPEKKKTYQQRGIQEGRTGVLNGGSSIEARRKKSDRGTTKNET